jgi:hypothetical protein
MIRRNLSQIYIYEKFDGEEKKTPTSFEDCTKLTQDRWLDSLDNKALKHLAKMLAETLREIGDELNLVKEWEK